MADHNISSELNDEQSQFVNNAEDFISSENPNDLFYDIKDPELLSLEGRAVHYFD